MHPPIFTMLYYTGIGARKTPDDIINLIVPIAKELASRNWILRSGGASGADSAFEYAVDTTPHAMKEIYLPWQGFNARNSFFSTIPKEVYDIIKEVIPHYKKIRNNSVKKLHARNVLQLLGYDLNLENKSKFVIYFAEERNGCPIGETAVALGLAQHFEIPCINLRKIMAQDPDSINFFNTVVDKYES